MRSIRMSKVPPGAYRVTAILAASDLAARLQDLGLRVGDAIDVLANRGADGVLVGRGDARLAVDQATASKVQVVAPTERR